MIDDTIKHIEENVRSASTLKEEQKKELIRQLGELRKEIADLSKTDPEQARSIAGFTQVSMHEAIRGKKNPELTRISANGLEESIRRFEVTNPRLVSVIDEIMQLLSGMGI